MSVIQETVSYTHLDVYKRQVVDSEEDDAECLILREVEESKDAEKTYEIVEDDTCLLYTSKIVTVHSRVNHSAD